MRWLFWPLMVLYYAALTLLVLVAATPTHLIAPAEAEYEVWLARSMSQGVISYETKTVFVSVTHEWSRGPKEWQERAVPRLVCFARGLESTPVPLSEVWGYKVLEMAPSYGAARLVAEGALSCEGVPALPPMGWMTRRGTEV